MHFFWSSEPRRNCIVEQSLCKGRYLYSWEFISAALPFDPTASEYAIDASWRRAQCFACYTEVNHISGINVPKLNQTIIMTYSFCLSNAILNCRHLAKSPALSNGANSASLQPPRTGPQATITPWQAGQALANYYSGKRPFLHPKQVYSCLGYASHPYENGKPCNGRPSLGPPLPPPC